MIARVTSHTQMRSAQRNLHDNMAQLAKLQDQASSLKAITRPSDNPTAAADAMKVRAELRATEQYGRNVDDGNGWVSTLDATLSSASATMNRVRDLTVQGASDGALSPAAKEAIAMELEGLRREILGQANTSYLGRSVFAGNSDSGVAFSGAPGYAHSGAPGSTVERRISPDSTVRVDADGAAVFGDGAGSVFALIDAIAADLRNGTNIGSRLADIDARMSAMTTEHTRVGAQQAQIERAEDSLKEQSGLLESQRAGIEDLDLGQVILDLKLQEVTYQAALAVTARVLQPTLMDFLR